MSLGVRLRGTELWIDQFSGDVHFQSKFAVQKHIEPASAEALGEKAPLLQDLNPQY